MKNKKFIALLLVAAMSFGTLAACGKNPANSQGTEKSSETQVVESSETVVASTEVEETKGVTFPLSETMKFTAFTTEYSGTDLSERLAFTEYMAACNIEVDFTVALLEEVKEKRNIILNTGNYPDFLIKDNFSDVTAYAEEGILIPLEDLIAEYAPNLTALLDELNGWADITSADGHIYSLPEIKSTTESVTPLWINKKWLDNLGLKEPTNFEELYDVLVAFKEKDANGNGDPNDEIPVAFNTNKTPIQLMYISDLAFNSSTNCAVTADGELIYLPTDEYFKELLGFAAKLYDEGLMYNESFTKKRAELQALGQSADILGCYPETASFQMVGRDNDDDYVVILPEAKMSSLSNGVAMGAMCITDKCENPEVLIAFVDNFYSEEGGKLAYMGIEGESYKYNEDGTWEWILGEHGDNVDTLRANTTMQGGGSIPAKMPEAWFDMSATVDEDEVYLNEQRVLLAQHSVIAMPKMTYSAEQDEKRSVIEADTKGYVKEYMAKVITGELDVDESWDSYVAEMEKMGSKELFTIYKDAYDRGIALRK